MMKKYLYSLFAVVLTTGSSAFAADCTAVGQKVAADQGGQLTKATAEVQNGKNVCVVVVLVPGQNGEKPRRVEVAVPAG